MVEHLLDQITSQNIDLKTEVNIRRSSQSSTFVKAYTYVSTVVVILYSSNNPLSGLFIKSVYYATGYGDRGSIKGRRFNA